MIAVSVCIIFNSKKLPRQMESFSACQLFQRFLCLLQSGLVVGELIP